MGDYIKPRLVAKGRESHWATLVAQVPTGNLLSSNSKLSKSNILQWSIPAYKADIGGVEVITCPAAGSCKKFCYAQQGGYLFNAAVIAHTRKLVYYKTHPEAWKTRLMTEIKFNPNIAAVRVHDSGDFFSLEYVLDWFEVMNACPDKKFYAYTKMVGLFEKLKAENKIPPNFTITYSFGGTQDHLIDVTRHKHSKVFATHAEMVQAGYSDTTDKDDNAVDPNPMCIGLVYHGAPKWKGHAT